MRKIRDSKAYGDAAISSAYSEVVDAAAGEANETLNKKAFGLGKLCAEGLLDQDRVVEELQAAAAARRIPAPEATDTIKSGLKAGLKRPSSEARFAGTKKSQDENRKKQSAREIWEQSEPIGGTQGEEYLHGRNIIDHYDVLRFNARCPDDRGGEAPALVAQVIDLVSGEPTGGIHRTFLGQRDGKITKAQMDKPKRALGPIGAGGVLFGDMSGDTLVVAEGIETALSCKAAVAYPCVAVLGTRAGSLHLPSRIRRVILAGEIGSEKVFEDAASKLAARGFDVAIAVPPAPLLNGAGKDMNDLAQIECGIDHVSAALEEAVPFQRPERGRFTPKTLAEVTETANTSWLIKNVLTSRGVSIIYGATQAGKTFVTLDVAAHVVLGKPWCGHRVTKGRVLYVGLEGGGGISDRVKAIMQHHHLSPDAGLGFVVCGMDLLTDLAEFRDEAIKFAPSWIIIDTLSRAMGEGEENNASDVNRVIQAAEKIGQAVGCHVTFVHHSGHGSDRERGSSALRANVDASLAVTKEKSGGHQIAFKKVRDAANERVVLFDLVPVDLGLDDEGDPITSCVVHYVEGKPPETFRKKLSDREKVAMDCLDRALMDNGALSPNGKDNIPDKLQWVSIENWRDYCHNGGFADGRDGDEKQKKRFNTAFGRVVESLKAKSVIGVWEDAATGKRMVWRTRDPSNFAP